MKKKKTKKSQSELNHIERDERLEDALEAIMNLFEPFCRKYLNEEYLELCEDMALEIYDAGAPLDQGKPESWASGIVHALGVVNLFSDPSSTPYMESSQIAEIFGVSQNAMLNKSEQICDELDLIPNDPEWCLESMRTDNPLEWLLEAEDVIADIFNAPREVQEQVYEEGLIPFIPADYPKQSKKLDKSKIKIIQFPSNKKKKKGSEPVSKQKDANPTLFDKSKD